MYFVDLARSLGEVRRVLCVHGLASFVAWGPLEMNPFFGCALGPFFSRLRPPPPPPDAPAPFRFATEGRIAVALGEAGFLNVREERLVVPMSWPGTPQELWQHIYEVGAPLRPVFDGLAPPSVTGRSAKCSPASTSTSMASSSRRRAA
jgi:hypothetical protein